MGKTTNDPIDHSRTTRKHAGETMKNGTNAPGLLLIAVAIVSLVLGLAAFATGTSVGAVVASGVSAVCFLAGAGWLFMAHRRVRHQELRWHAKHPRAAVQPPGS